jgi:hypothetical protein
VAWPAGWRRGLRRVGRQFRPTFSTPMHSGGFGYHYFFPIFLCTFRVNSSVQQPLLTPVVRVHPSSPNVSLRCQLARKPALHCAGHRPTQLVRAGSVTYLHRLRFQRVGNCSQNDRPKKSATDHASCDNLFPPPVRRPPHGTNTLTHLPIMPLGRLQLRIHLCTRSLLSDEHHSTHRTNHDWL